MFESKSIRETYLELDSDLVKGLTEMEAGRRLRANGKNELPAPSRKHPVIRFLEQLQDPLIYVLLAAAAVSLLLHEESDAAIILFVVLMNALIGLVQEGKAQKALDSLKKLTSPHAIVIRDGIKKEIPAAEIAIGDLVCLEAGCQVPADMRLTETESLKIEESTLTGESVPVEKNASFQAPHDIPIGDRHNMAYMSTIVTYGRGKGIAAATGPRTEIGRIASMIQTEKEGATPLQKRLGELGALLSILSLLLCALLFAIGVIQHRNLFTMLITAISLAVAAVPEGLPAIVTICLALSVTRMVRVHTIIRRLPSVETLGAVSVICSDKTGTLTQNKMRVIRCFCGQKSLSAAQLDKRRDFDFLAGMTLCNDAVLTPDNAIGDPTELALLELSGTYGITRGHLEKTMPRLKELPFDSDRKMMTTFHRLGSGTISYTKGAPDEILRLCSHILISGKISPITSDFLSEIKRHLTSMSSDALRTLAVAMKQGGGAPSEQGLVFLGLIGMQDPARPEAAPAVAACRTAGIDTVMITGDHIDTAYAIAKELSIVQSREECMSGAELSRLPKEAFLKKLDRVRVFARISPQQKVQIVKGFQAKGGIVAMTGDGVNDAPSLKAADVGIAMGQNGTDVAKQAADVILTDDNFATIAKAVEEGRGVYENIKKSVLFLLSSNLGEMMTMFFAVICGLASPLKSSHILWINLITDSLPALALGIDENDGAALMRQPPRGRNESLFAGGGLACTCFYGILIAVISLTAFFTVPYAVLVGQRLAPDSLWTFVPEFPLLLERLSLLLRQETILQRSQTYAFTVLGMSQLFHAIGMRDIHTSVFRMHHLRNKLMLAAFCVGLFLQGAVTELPLLIRAFGTVHLSRVEWGFLILLAAFPLLAHELMILCRFGKRG
ncbi:MAG: cation-translocating P-type ATPase [Lachnospiraceae bacterium]|nr:cation-translocating P-type ATPase [Lachnospiraceae bacterium]